MIRNAVLTLAAVLVVAVALSWLTPRRPNVLLITLDSVRPDYLSCYGATSAPTPNIDALAAGGVLFSQAVCDVPSTQSSVASLMTGRYPTGHGVRTPYDRLPLGMPTLAEAFRRAGYRTGAVVASFEVDHIFQLDQGFDSYDDRFDLPMLGGASRPLHVASVFYGDRKQDRALRWWKLHADSIRPDEETTDAAIGWLKRAGGHPFFLWVQYFAAHERRSGRWDLAALIAQYRPGVRSADTAVGRLLRGLAELQLQSNTLVVLHADHGQALLEHGGFGHGSDLYEESVHVPLILRWPERLPAGRRVTALVRTVDMFPTIAELVGLQPDARADGQSLAGLLLNGAVASPGEAYLETYGSALVGTSREIKTADGGTTHVGFVRRGLRRGAWKFIRNDPSPLVDLGPGAEPAEEIRRALASEELYDLERDPRERDNVVDREPAAAAELRRRLAGYVDGQRQNGN